MSKKAFVEFPSGLKLPKELLRAALGACFIFVLFGVYLFLRAYSSRDDVPEQAEQAEEAPSVWPVFTVLYDDSEVTWRCHRAKASVVGSNYEGVCFIHCDAYSTGFSVRLAHVTECDESKPFVVQSMPYLPPSE